MDDCIQILQKYASSILGASSFIAIYRGPVSLENETYTQTAVTGEIYGCRHSIRPCALLCMRLTRNLMRLQLEIILRGTGCLGKLDA